MATKRYVIDTRRRPHAQAPGLRRIYALAAALFVGGGGCGRVSFTASPDGTAGRPPDAMMGMAGEHDGGGSTPDAGACGGDVDITSDGANCGACGHSCGGGACVASRCQPV